MKGAPENAASRWGISDSQVRRGTPDFEPSASMLRHLPLPHGRSSVYAVAPSRSRFGFRGRSLTVAVRFTRPLSHNRGSVHDRSQPRQRPQERAISLFEVIEIVRDVEPENRFIRRNQLFVRGYRRRARQSAGLAHLFGADFRQ